MTMPRDGHIERDSIDRNACSDLLREALRAIDAFIIAGEPQIELTSALAAAAHVQHAIDLLNEPQASQT